MVSGQCRNARKGICEASFIVRSVGRAFSATQDSCAVLRIRLVKHLQDNAVTRQYTEVNELNKLFIAE